MKSMECYFSGSADLSEIISLELLKASKSIFLAMYTLTDHQLIHTLRQLGQKNIDIFALFDEAQLLHFNNVILELNNSGIQFKTIGNPNSRMHNKFIVIDKSKVITGSFNWTEQASKSNMENIVIINDEQIAHKYVNEFNRIWKRICSKPPELKAKEKPDDLEDFITHLDKSKHISKKYELPLPLRDMAIGKVYFFMSKGEYQKSMRIIDFLLEIEPDMLIAAKLKSEILNIKNIK
jgi:phospholipase D